jgi:NitT/TauT family transport system substrate-binding protein
MTTLFGLARGIAVAAAVLALAAAAPRPALADDALTVLSGSFPTAYFEVLGDVADKAGFYKEEHLDVTTQYVGNPSLAIQALASGKGDVASIGLEPMLQGYEKGLRMTAFLARDPHLQQVLGVLEGSPIHTLADFKGTTIGELTLGQPGEIYTKVMLAGAGLKPGDYSFAPIGNGAQAIQALVTGKVAGAAFPGPELRIYEVTANLKFRYFREPIIADSSDVGYVASPATLAARADVLRRFSRAIVKAAIVCRVNPQLAAKYFVESSGMKGHRQRSALAGELDGAAPRREPDERTDRRDAGPPDARLDEVHVRQRPDQRGRAGRGGGDGPFHRLRERLRP